MLRIEGDENNQENYDTKDNNDTILQDVNTNIQNEVNEIENIIFKIKFLDTTFQSPVIQGRKIYLNIIYILTNFIYQLMKSELFKKG